MLRSLARTADPKCLSTISILLRAVECFHAKNQNIALKIMTSFQTLEILWGKSATKTLFFYLFCYHTHTHTHTHTTTTTTTTTYVIVIVIYLFIYLL